MTTMHPAMDAALAASTATIFGAVEIVLPSHTIRLLTGSGIAVFDGKTFTGRDATYGVLHTIDTLDDGTGDEAPAITLTLVPASDAAAADLAGADMQGAAVSIWLGVLDPTSGLVVGEPLLIFLGVLDIPTLKVSKNSRLLDLEITSAFEGFFITDDGARLNDNWHSYVWPGERGLKFVTAVSRNIYWGGSPASGVDKSAGSAGAGRTARASA